MEVWIIMMADYHADTAYPYEIYSNRELAADRARYLNSLSDADGDSDFFYYVAAHSYKVN